MDFSEEDSQWKVPGAGSRPGEELSFISSFLFKSLLRPEIPCPHLGFLQVNHVSAEGSPGGQNVVSFLCPDK